MTRILVVEDDATLRTVVCDTLRLEGYEPVAAADGPRGRAAALEGSCDLVILDLMLPGRGGLEILRELRARGTGTPVLILTAKGDETDKVTGLELGADDYMTKPFGLRELVARVRALLRRAGPSEAKAARFAIGDVEVDLEAFTVRRGKKALPLSPREAAMLRLLWEQRGKVVTRGRFLAEVWGGLPSISDRTIDTHVLNLRRKLERDARRPRALLTVHGAGYKLVVPDAP